MEDDDDEEEVVEFEEFMRCALLRGISIRVTSSLIESIPSPPLLHLSGCKLGGDATAVICIAVCFARIYLWVVSPLPNPTFASP